MRGFLTTAFYYMNVAWIRVLLFFSASRDVRGQENVPRDGPLILVSNHLNNADPPLVTTATPRRISWLTKAEWFSTPIIGVMFRMAGMIPVRRFDADLRALWKAQDLLTRGGCLGMFPEGTRSHGTGLGEGQPGTALIALRSGATVQPVAIWGTEHVKLPRDIFRRTRVHIRFGEPFRIDARKRATRADVEAGTKRIMTAIADLLPEEYRGAYRDNAASQSNGGCKTVSSNQ